MSGNSKILSTLFLVSLAAQTLPGQSVRQAFRTPSRIAPVPDHLRDRAVVRVRAIELDTSLFDRAAAKRLGPDFRSGSFPRTDMNFFDNASFRVLWTGVDQAGDRQSMVWTGSVEGMSFSQAVMVVSDTLASGNISTGDGRMFQIRSTQDGGRWVREIDQRQFPNEANSLIPPAAGATAASVVPLGAGEDAALPDDGSTIDVMVLYTPAVTRKLGGAAIAQQTVQLGIAETNLGYQNSGVIQRVRLVYSGEVQYTEDSKMDTDLGRLTDPNDGYIDIAHRLRDTYNADLVSMWGDYSGNPCGIAWILKDSAVPPPSGTPAPRPDRGFSVVDYSCATGYYSFGHEMGHNMGATHAREDNTGEGAYPYSNGLKQPNGSNAFRTVMAYNCPNNCTRVNYWSNPAVSYRSQATGIAQSDPSSAANYLTLNSTRSVVANYRPSGGGSGGGSGFPESDHPYVNNADKTYSFSLPGAAALNVTFDAQTALENGYDFLYVSDGNGNQIPGSPFTSNSLANRTVTVQGTTVKIRLVSDDAVTDYGFKVTSITATGGGGNLPKLVVTSLTAPTTATIGTNLTGVRISLVNQGTAAAGAFRLAYYYSRNRNVTTTDIFSGWYCTYDNGLTAGGTTSCNGDVGVPSTLGPGTWYLAAIADDQNKVAQSDRAGNVRPADSGTIAISGGTAAELVQPVPGSVLTSATVAFRWSAGTGVSGYQLAVGTTLGGSSVYNQNQGTSLSATVSGLPTNGATLYIRLTSSIGNGTVFRDYTVAAVNVPAASNLPKLVIAGFSAPTSAQAGVTLHNMSMTIANRGTGNAGAFRIGFYYSRSINVTTSSTFSGWYCTYGEGLVAGSSNVCSGDVGVPSTLAAGTWYMAAIADDQGILQQADSSGSTRVNDNGPLTVAGNNPASMLVPSAGSTLASSTVAFRWDTGSGAEQYYLDIGSAAGGSDIYHGDLGLGLSATVTGLPTDGSTLYARLSTRFGGDFISNDYTYRSFRSGSAGSVPRIVVTSFTAPTAGTIGVNLQGTRVVISNQGNANAGPFRLAYYFSKNSNVTTSDVFSGWVCPVTNGLAIGNTYTCSGDLGVPAALTAGKWYVAIIADDLGQLPQADRSGSIRVADTGPLSLVGGAGGGLLPESSHPYENNSDRSWTYTVPGNPSAIKVTFNPATSVEAGYDFIYVYDGKGAQIPLSPFTGQDLANKAVVVPGATVRIRLVSDESVNDYGFRVNSIADAGDLPKLVVTLFSAPSSGKPGVNLQNMQVVVANQGPADAKPFNIGFYYGRTPNVSTNDTDSQWSCSVKSLAAGSRYACGGEIGVPTSLTPGTWYLAAIADDGYIIDQSDRAGNVRVNDNGGTMIGATISSPEDAARPNSGINVSGVSHPRQEQR